VEHEFELVRRDMAALDQKLTGAVEGLRAEFHKDLRNLLIALTTMMSALAGAVIAVVSHVS
jgi:hypothetical protein